MGRAGSRNNTRKSSGRNKVLEDLGQPELPLLYEKQGRFVNDSARYTVCEAGTKSGKTLGCASWIVKNAWEQPETLWWWVAPSYGQALIAFQLMVSGERLSADANERRGGPISRMLEPKSQCKVRRTGLCPEIELLQGSLIQFRTASEPNRLYGAGVAGVVIDEASRLREEAFFAIRSTLTMTRGPMKIIGNPRGTRNWFYRLCVKAKSGAPDHSYHHLVSADNPFILAEEIEDARRTLPERIFNELYLGIAEEGEGQVFTHIGRVCVLPSVEAPIEGHQYVIGWDVARKTDFSAVSVIDFTAHPMREALIERLSDLNYEAQFARVAHLSRNYFNARVNFDGTSVGGDLIAEITRKSGIPATPFVFTSTSKAEIVNRLAAKLENEELLLQAAGKDADVARSELEIFEIILRPNGAAPRYGAPAGTHDDTVIARCLALDAVVHPVSMPHAGIFDFVVHSTQTHQS